MSNNHTYTDPDGNVYESYEAYCNDPDLDMDLIQVKLSKVMNASKDYTADAKSSFVKICDKIFESDEEQEAYCKEHNIPF